MRKLLLTLLVLGLIAGGIAFYLFSTTPKQSAGVRFALSPAQRALVAQVPNSAESFALIPTAAALEAKLRANPITRDAIESFAEKQALPRPWMLGGADLLVWREAGATSYAIRFDSVRATIVRIWTMIAGPHDASWDGNVMLIADSAASPNTPVDLTLSNGLPEGDAFVVQRSNARGAFPPIARPVFSSLRITPKEITIVSRAQSHELPPPTPPIQAKFPKGAMLAVAFADPPRILGDLNRFLGTDIGDLVSNGGSIALYDVDAGLLLPQPKGVIAIPADDRGRAALAKYTNFISLVGETREVNGQLLVSFDRRSVPAYINDATVAAAWPATRWSGRIDPAKLLPVLRRLGDNRALRFAAPRIYRSVRDLRNWIDALENAESIEAAESANGGIEELRVRVVSK